MTEKKNKDGITLRVDQKWSAKRTNEIKPCESEVIGFHGEKVVVWFKDSGGTEDAASPKPGIWWFATLLFDPIWGDMSQHVIVTDEQSEMYNKPSCAEWFVSLPGTNGSWSSIDSSTSWATVSDGKVCRTYRVPADHVWEPVEPENPKFRLFKIDWSAARWTISNSISFDVGELIDGCRMIGYTDNAGIMETDDILNDAYPKQPSDHTGNRKYAIGRLESQQ